MKLYLLRHGLAEDHSGTGQDADRALTTQGIAGLERVLTLAHGAGVRPSLILSSPYARAVQTAGLALRELEYDGKILRSPAFAPDSSPFRAWEEIRAHDGEPSILVASHEPLLSSMVAWLAGSTQVMVRFVPAAMVRIDFESVSAHPAGVMHWMISPDL